MEFRDSIELHEFKKFRGNKSRVAAEAASIDCSDIELPFTELSIRYLS